MGLFWTSVLGPLAEAVIERELDSLERVAPALSESVLLLALFGEPVPFDLLASGAERANRGRGGHVAALLAIGLAERCVTDGGEPCLRLAARIQPAAAFVTHLRSAESLEALRGKIVTWLDGSWAQQSLTALQRAVAQHRQLRQMQPSEPTLRRGLEAARYAFEAQEYDLAMKIVRSLPDSARALAPSDELSRLMRAAYALGGKLAAYVSDASTAQAWFDQARCDRFANASGPGRQDYEVELLFREAEWQDGPDTLRGEALLRQAFEAAQALGDAPLLRLATHARWLAARTRAMRSEQDAQAVVDEATLLVDAYGEPARWPPDWTEKEFQDAMHYVGTALAAQGQALQSHHLAEWAQGQHAFERALRYWQRARNPAAVANGWVNLGNSAFRRDEIHEARECYRRAEEHARFDKRGHISTTVPIELNLADCELGLGEDGDIREALRRTDRALERLASARNPNFSTEAYCLRSRALSRLGHQEDARMAALQALQVAESAAGTESADLVKRAMAALMATLPAPLSGP